MSVRGKARIIFAVPVLIILGLLACGLAFIKSDFAAEVTCSKLRAGLQERVDLRVSIEACAIELLPPALSIKGIRVLDRSGSRLLSASSVRVVLDSLSLLAGDLQIERVVVHRPRVTLQIVDGALANLPRLTQPDAQRPSETAEVDFFPRHLQVEGGRLDLLVDRWGLLQVRDVDLSLVSARRGQMELALEIGGGNLDLAGGRGTSLTIQSSGCKANLQGQRVELEHCALRLDGLSAQARGRLSRATGAWDPQLELTAAFELSLLHQFLPQVPQMQGQAVVSFETGLDEGGHWASGAIDVKGFGIVTVADVAFQSRFRIDGRRLQLLDLRASSRGGTVSGTARLDWNEALGFQGALVVERIDLQQGLQMGGIRWRQIDLRGEGQLQFSGRFLGKGAPQVTLETQLGMERFAVFAEPSQAPVLPFDGATLEAKAAFDGRRVHIRPVRLEKGETVVTAEGRIRFQDGHVQARLQSDQLHLSDLSPIAELLLDGDGGLTVDVAGSVFDPEIDARLHVRDLLVEDRPFGHLRGRVALGDGQLRFEPLVVSRHAGSVRLTAQLGLDAPHRLKAAAELSQIRLPELVAAVRLKRLPGFVGGRMGGQVMVSGTLGSPVMDFRLAFAELQLGGQRIEEGGAIGRYAGGAWHLDLLEASMGSGWLFARGEISADLDLNLVAYSTGLKAASFQILAPTASWLDFRLDMHVALRGPLRSPALDGWVKVYDTVLSGRRIADSSLTANASAESFEVQGKFVGETARLKLLCQLQPGLPFEGSLVFASDRLGQLLPRAGSAARPFAALGGALRAGGRLLAAEQMAAELRLDRAAVRLSGLRLENRKPVELVLRDGRLEVRSCELVGPETLLTVRGGGTLARGPALHVEGTLGLSLLPVLTDSVKRAAGRARASIDLDGPWQRPRLRGSLSFADGRMRVAGLTDDLEKVAGKILFTPEEVTLTRVRGRFGGGAFTVWGGVQLHDVEPTRLALNVELDKVRYQVNRNLWGRGTGTLNLAKEPGKRLRLSGQMRVHEGAFREHIALVTFRNGLLRRRRPRKPTYDKKNELLDFDVRLLVPERFQVLYNLDLVNFQAEMKGDLRVTGTNERLGLLGEMESLKGVVSYLSKDFAVDSTRVQLVEEYGIEPKVEIRASRTEVVDRGKYGLTNYLVSLGLSGEGDDLRVSLRSNPSLDERDIITLLSLGVTSRDVDQLQGDGLAGLGPELFIRYSKLDERLSKLFPFPRELIQPKYISVRSRFSDEAGTTTPHLETGVKLRLISEDLDLDYSRSLYDDADQSVDLSYRLAPGVSARMRWADSEKTEIGDLGLDLKLKWEW